VLHADEEPKDKNKRQVISLSEKVMVVEKFDRQMRIAAVVL
jgi:hypothetical protein